MSVIQAPIEDGGSASGGLERLNARDVAISDAVERCRPLAIRPTKTVDGDVIAMAIEACATGRSVYTATDGAGLFRMATALFRASHVGVPIVMTVRSANGLRDHGHTMALRDCGWVQLYPTDDQDAVDTHIQAFRIAESLSLPVMVCLDTFARAPATGRPWVPSGAEIDAFLGRDHSPWTPRPLDADEGLDVHMEMRYLTHAKQGAALDTIQQVAADFRARFGRRSGGILTTHHLYAAKLGVVGLGSAFESITDAVDELKRGRMSIGALGLRSFRPFPTHSVATELLHCQQVVIVERALAVGIGGIVSTDVRSALARWSIRTHTVVAGLGHRTISAQSLERALYGAAHGVLEELSFLDLDREYVRSSGSHARSQAGGVAA